MGKIIRLDKYLADLGLGTRNEVKTYIRKGRVRVNRVLSTKPEEKVDITLDEVLFDERRVTYQEYIYVMLHKPVGVVSATTDRADRTVLDLIDLPQKKELFPVGRLDKDTEGLLLLTNDGEMAHRLLSPKKHVDKVYFARVKGKVTTKDQQAFLEGVSIGEDTVTLPAKLSILVSDDISEIELTIQEGKFHQVKRMFEAVGKEVIYLKRLSMGSLSLDLTLAPGEYRDLTEEEIASLKELTAL